MRRSLIVLLQRGLHNSFTFIITHEQPFRLRRTSFLHDVAMSQSSSSRPQHGAQLDAVSLFLKTRPSVTNMAQQTTPDITILSISAFNQIDLPANSLELPVKPSTYDPGGVDAISTVFVARATGIHLRDLEAQALTGTCYIRVNWKLQLDYPTFTTRHLLVVTETLVAFAAGLAWAQRIERTAVRFQTVDTPLPRSILLPALPHLPAQYQQKTAILTGYAETSSQFQLTGWARDSDNLRAFSPPELPDTPSSMSPAPEDDQASTCSEYISGGASRPYSGRHPNFRLLSPPPSRKHSSHMDDDMNHEEAEEMVQQQIRLDLFQQQKREAEELYARNGDTSGLLAVLAAATQQRVNSQSPGAPRF